MSLHTTEVDECGGSHDILDNEQKSRKAANIVSLGVVVCADMFCLLEEIPPLSLGHLSSVETNI